MKAVLLCGGEGVRLRPLTCDTPKPMLPLLGRPLLEYTLRHLKIHGVDHASLTLGYLPEKVLEIAKTDDLDMKLDFYTEDKPLGTAGSVANAAGDIHSTFFVVSGDALTDMDLSSAWSFHKSTRALCTCILHREAEPSRFGVAVTDVHGRILKFQEKPHLCEAESFSVNTGIYILEPEVLSRIPKDRAYDFARDLFPELVEEGRLYGFKSEGYWSDIGSPRAYLQAQEDLMEDRVHFAFPQGRFERIHIADTAQIDSSALLVPPVWVGERCKIGQGCVIGPGSVIENDCVVSDRCGVKLSLVGAQSLLERNVQLRRVIACPQVHCMEDSRAFEGSILGKTTQVGRMATVAAQVRIWPHKKIPDRAWVGQDVVFGHTQRDSIWDNGVIRGVYGRDLPVGYLSRVALAVAQSLPRGAKIALACGENEEAQSVARIFTGAMNEQTLHVIQLGDVSLGMLQDAVPRMKMNAGLRIESSGRKLVIDLLNQAGFHPDPNQIRKIDDALERMAESVCVGEIGKSLAMDGVRQAYLRECRKWAGRKKPVPVRIESDGAVDEELLKTLNVAQTEKTQDALFTLKITGDSWTFLDEKANEFSDPQKRSALWQAALETGRIKGIWPIQSDCWSADVQKAGRMRGVEWLRVSSRQDLWIRALIRQEHSARIDDAGIFFDPYLGAAMLTQALQGAQLPLSEWFRMPTACRTDIQAGYSQNRAYEVMERLHRLRAEASEMFDGGLRIQDTDDLFVEWGGDGCCVRIHGNTQNRERLQTLLDTLLE